MGHETVKMKQKNSTPTLLRSINSLSRRALRPALFAALLAGLTIVAAPSAYAVVQTCDEPGLNAALAAGGTNTFSCGVATTITVSATKTVSVSGTVLDGGGLLTISGGGVRRVFAVNAGVTATFQNLTIANGAVAGGLGGGINNGGTLTISNSTFSGNSTTGGFGGGINNSGTLTISNSTFSGNSAALGGGISNSSNGSTLTISNSTFSGNSATPGNGGGIFADTGTVTTINNSTFSGNSGTVGGAISRNGGTVTLKNSIVANSTSGSNCSGTIADGGNNLQFGGSTANSCGATITIANPLLGALTGSPAYFPLNAGSAAIDTGSNALCAAAPVNNASQNGVTRPVDGDGNGTATCDIGSYEAPALPSIIATPAKPIPTLSEWAMLLLAAMLAMFGMKEMARRRHLEP